MRLPFRTALAVAISLGGLVVLLAAQRAIQQPAEVTVVEREAHGRVDMSLGSNRWSVDGFGEVARARGEESQREFQLLLRERRADLP